MSYKRQAKPLTHIFLKFFSKKDMPNFFGVIIFENFLKDLLMIFFQKKLGAFIWDGTAGFKKT